MADLEVGGLQRTSSKPPCSSAAGHTFRKEVVRMIDVGLLVLRLVLGVIFIGHGAQKLFGSFGGPRISGFAKMLEQLGVKPAKPMAILAGLAEFGGGILVMLAS